MRLAALYWVCFFSCHVLITSELLQNYNKGPDFAFLIYSMTRLSVIIPVFNSQTTLHRCVDSVLSQNISGMEVILVDDGSTDNSPAMCDALAARYDSVHVIHRPNGGLSAARNTGIDAAKGEWITFIDSDDALAPDTLNGNLEYALQLPDTDVVEYPVTVRYGAPDSFSFDFKPVDTTGSQVFEYWVQSKGYNHCFACNKIFRATLFDGIRFPLGESFEDAAVCPAIIRASRTVRYSDIGRYLYYKSEGSITRKYRFGNQEPLFRHNIALLEEITGQDFGAQCRLDLWSVCLNLLTDLRRCMDAQPDYIRSQAARLQSLKPHPAYILHSALPFRQKLKVTAAYCLGTRTVCNILGIRKFS